MTYTGDTGPSPLITDLARGVDVFVCDASYPVDVPAADADYLGSARLAGEYAAAAGAGRLVLAHLMPDVDADAAVAAVAAAFTGPVHVARPGLVLAAE